MSIHSATSTSVAKRLGKLARLYEQGQASEMMARTLDKLIQYEAKLSQEQLSEIQQDLATFETRYNLSTRQFYLTYQAGQTDDRMDFVEWASLAQMAENLERRIKLLSTEDKP